MTQEDERKELQAQAVEDHDDDDDDEMEGFEGPWYAFPPIRNALIAGALLVIGWLVSLLRVPVYIPYGIYGLGILIGAYYL